ncbi:pyridoxal-phosphate-dependent aminotransferase family protein [Aerococcus loyolae]|uniref:pyridoxal-phosphate-dependent aminotransferase family protein n=1 Tax=Aerococcus loyolae TaxID=2976809 RepID=UPI0008A2EBAC|nr:aminotransferase class V-fold PLP-dependent enzyme [Aerococcus loyolae]OFL18846.1 aminotransferase [Aerococcus loyolae]
MLNLCPGPTHIPQAVLKAYGQAKTNPDIDHKYTQYQRQVENQISQLLHTKAVSFFMVGEALLALEAAVNSIIQPGDRVLVISNGVYGQGFQDFVNFVKAEVVLYESDWRRGINLNDLKAFLENDHDFQVATFVHCETPTGITNDIHGIGQILNSYNILSIVDSVSAIGGEYINFDQAKVDVLLGGSQKCFSAPVGLASVTLSKRAIEHMENRHSPIPSFYANFQSYLSFDDPHFDFPYTMNDQAIYAMDVAIKQAIDSDFANKHQKWAEATRQLFKEAGFELYAKDHASNTLTSVLLPESVSSLDVMKLVKDEGILITKGDGPQGERLLRIAHMGSNMEVKYFQKMYHALDKSFHHLGIKYQGELEEKFMLSDIAKNY